MNDQLIEVGKQDKILDEVIIIIIIFYTKHYMKIKIIY
jgi:hypothetical protein